MDTVDVQTVAARPAVPLIDVREPDEFAEVHAPRARPVPLGQIADHLDDFPKDQTVYVICASGRRSAQAVEAMRRSGIAAVSVEGGTQAWVAAGLPTEGER